MIPHHESVATGEATTNTTTTDAHGDLPSIMNGTTNNNTPATAPAQSTVGTSKQKKRRLTVVCIIKGSAGRRLRSCGRSHSL